MPAASTLRARPTRRQCTLPRSRRRRHEPHTPSVHQVCSKRSFDGQIKKWRRELHEWAAAHGHGQQHGASSSEAQLGLAEVAAPAGGAAAAVPPEEGPEAGGSEALPPVLLHNGRTASQPDPAAAAAVALAGDDQHAAAAAVPAGAGGCSGGAGSCSQQEGDEDLTCIICMERGLEIVLVPCGHCVLCGSCWEAERQRQGQGRPCCLVCSQEVGAAFAGAACADRA